MPPAVIDLLSSPEIPTSYRDSLERSTKTNPSPPHPVSLPPPLRSSPRRRAAAAAIARLESSTTKHRIEDEFGSDPFGSDPFATSPAVLKLTADISSHKLQNVIERNTRVVEKSYGASVLRNDPLSDPFASSPLANRELKTTAMKDAASTSTCGFLDLSAQVDDELVFAYDMKTATTHGKTLAIERVEAHDAAEQIILPSLPLTSISRMESVPSRESPQKGQIDFVFLSDDFDTTIDIESSFVVLPQDGGRKRSLSHHSPTEANTKRTKLVDGKVNSRRSDMPLTKASSEVLAVATKGKATGLRRTKSNVEDDPILFTSSPEIRRTKTNAAGACQAENKPTSIADSSPLPAAMSKKARPQHSKTKILTLSSDDDLPEVGNIKTHAGARKLKRVDSKSALAEYNKVKLAGELITEKASEKSQKVAARDAERDRKRSEKDAKAREKQLASEIAKVNTLKTDKKTSSPKMIVDLPVSFEKKLYNQLVVFLGPLGIDVQEATTRVDVKNIIQFRRKIEAIYDENAEHWRPVAKHIRKEPHIISLLSAQEFVDLSMGPEGSDLDSHVLRLKAAYEDCAIIYLIDGLTAWMKKNRSVKNKQFTDAVRNQDTVQVEDLNVSTTTTTRRKRKEREYVDEDMIEDSLLKLQVVHGTLIHHTTSTIDTAQWIVAFTQHISTIPYRHQKMSLSTAFCMETGQVKTGDNPADTFVKMLQEINRITPSIAYGIAAAYPSASKLLHAYKEKGDDDGAAKDMLMGLKKSSNKDGAFSDANLGRSISRRVWKIFMGRDEGSTEV